MSPGSVRARIPWVVISAIATLVPTQRVVPFLSAAGAPLGFAVASIKPNREKTTLMGVRQFSHGRLIAENTPLRFLIGVAYKRRDGWFEISGAPGWVDSERYDITAKAEGDATNEQMYPMLRTLLADRFQLKFHRETKDLPVYFLTPAKRGLKLPNSKARGCFAGISGAQPPRPQPGKLPAIPCGNVVIGLSPQGLRLQGGETTMQRLAASLAGVLRRTVIDKTGFSGTFDIDLEFTPDDSLAGIPARGEPGALPAAPAADAAAPSIFTALQEQCGLRLEPAKGPVSVFIIDGAAKPAAN